MEKEERSEENGRWRGGRDGENEWKRRRGMKEEERKNE